MDVLEQKQLFVLQGPIKNVDPHSRLHLLGAVTAVAVSLQDRLDGLPELGLQLRRHQLGVAVLLLGKSERAPQGKDKSVEPDCTHHQG